MIAEHSLWERGVAGAAPAFPTLMLLGLIAANRAAREISHRYKRTCQPLATTVFN